MKLTRKRFKQIIKEEYRKILAEGGLGGSDPYKAGNVISGDLKEQDTIDFLEELSGMLTPLQRDRLTSIIMHQVRTPITITSLMQQLEEVPEVDLASNSEIFQEQLKNIAELNNMIRAKKSL